jgi:folate-binding protein YgfZ
MARALLPDRGVIEISGVEAAGFLHNLVTNSVADLSNGQACFTALLTPQGKIIADGFIVKAADKFFFDCPKALAAELLKKLTLYRLRAPVALQDRSGDYDVIAGWDEQRPDDPHVIAFFDDPRFIELGWRAIIAKEHTTEFAGASNVDTYHAYRIALGIPEGGKDFAYGDIFPHEADMDQLHGVDFKKGCYIGQEVVSRMQHRGLARTRAVPVTFHDGFLPESGTSAEAGGKQIGTIGSGIKGGHAIAILRLDRVEEAIAGGAELTAGGLAFSLETRPWIGFSVPRSK